MNIECNGTYANMRLTAIGTVNIFLYKRNPFIFVLSLKYLTTVLSRNFVIYFGTKISATSFFFFFLNR